MDDKRQITRSIIRSTWVTFRNERRERVECVVNVLVASITLYHDAERRGCAGEDGKVSHTQRLLVTSYSSTLVKDIHIPNMHYVYHSRGFANVRNTPNAYFLELNSLISIYIKSYYFIGFLLLLSCLLELISYLILFLLLDISLSSSFIGLDVYKVITHFILKNSLI